MIDFKNKKILFIGPVFYDYHDMIVSKLEQKGAIVEFKPERSYGLIYRILNNTSNKLLLHYQKRHYKNLLRTISSDRFDYLFVIRGCQMPKEFIVILKERYPSIFCIMYQWDSEKANHFINLLPEFDSVFTFDINDSVKYKLKYLPLFYTDDLLTIYNTGNKIKYDFFSLCSYNRDRYRILTDLKKELLDYNVNFKIYIPITTYFKELIKGVRLSKEMLIFTPVSRIEYLIILMASKIIIDISPKTQSGLPIRVIESYCTGKTIISTNKYIKTEFFESQNVYILSKEIDFKEIIEKKPDEHGIIKDYSLDEWLNKLFNIDYYNVLS